MIKFLSFLVLFLLISNSFGDEFSWTCVLSPNLRDCKEKFATGLVNVDFEALTINRIENKTGQKIIRSKIVYIFKDSFKKFKIGDEFETKSTQAPLYGMSFFYGMYGQDSSFTHTLYENTRENFHAENILEPLLRIGNHNENFWQYMYFCDNRHDIRTRHPDNLNFSETSIMLMHNTPYENWLAGGDSVVELSLNTFRDYLKSIKKSDKQVKKFEEALQKRSSLKIDSLKADFVALGSIWKSIQHNGYCETYIAPRHIFKEIDDYDHQENNAFWLSDMSFGKPFVTISAQKKGPCFSLDKMFKEDYLTGHYEDLKLVLDTTFSSWDYIYHNDLLIDLSFGLPYEKFLTYLLPDKLTLDDVITQSIYGAYGIVYKEMTKETFKKVDQVLKKINKVCKEYD